MEKPKITFNDEEIEIANVKAKAWRAASKIQSRDGEVVPVGDMINFIVTVFDDSRVTAERIEDEVNLDEVYPLFLRTYAYVIDLVTAGLERVNAESKKKETGN